MGNPMDIMPYTFPDFKTEEYNDTFKIAMKIYKKKIK